MVQKLWVSTKAYLGGYELGKTYFERSSHQERGQDLAVQRVHISGFSEPQTPSKAEKLQRVGCFKNV